MPTNARRCTIPAGRYPALVLNADFTPLSHLPLSLWSWKDSVRAVFRDAVTVVATYNATVRSPSFEMPLPSIVVLKEYQSSKCQRQREPVLTRRNVFLRDEFCCQYCRNEFKPTELTYDHVVPQSKGGPTTWTNVVSACSRCNLRKGSKSVKDLPADMRLAEQPRVPSWDELQRKARRFPPKLVHEDWVDFIGMPLARRGASPTTHEDELVLDGGGNWGI